MKEVTIYSTQSCHYCQLAKEFFDKNNIKYTQYDVGNNPEKRAEMIQLSGQLGVPVIHIEDTVLVGFQEGTLSELLLS
jgi:glutaredoxin 3